MRKQHENRNLSMVMDFYEMTMANGYFAARDTDTLAVFDVFYRKNPDNAGFAAESLFRGISGLSPELSLPRRHLRYAGGHHHLSL